MIDLEVRVAEIRDRLRAWEEYGDDEVAADLIFLLDALEGMRKERDDARNERDAYMQSYVATGIATNSLTRSAQRAKRAPHRASQVRRGTTAQIRLETVLQISKHADLSASTTHGLTPEASQVRLV